MGKQIGGTSGGGPVAGEKFQMQMTAIFGVDFCNAAHDCYFQLECDDG